MNSNRINLIIGREYWTRVKSKTFLLTTFLAPIGIILIYAFLGFLMTRGSDNEKKIAIIDNAGIAQDINLQRKNLTFEIKNESLQSLIGAYEKGDYDGIIELPPLDSTQQKYEIIYHSDKTLALDESSSIESMFRREIRDFKIQAFGIDQAQLDLIDTSVDISPKTIKDKEKEISSITTTVSSALGGIVGMLLFMVILIFGSQVMRGVNEEKINRIVEVLISSVKPIELMIGKVLGIGLVGLTQFAIWGILIGVLSFIASAVFGLETSAMSEMANNEMAQEVMANEGVKTKILQVMKELMGMNWAMMIPLYIFYFFIGYLLYASVFAAVGAAAGDDINEAQSLTTIVMLPLIAGFYIAMSAIQAPDSTAAVWGSIFPLTGPVVMPTRLPSDPPTWQIALSVVLSLLTVIGLIWMAARIYRVGILMYGKKASFKELGKWIFYKG